MQFLKTMLWCLVAFVAAIFTRGNWSWVSINLWGDLIAEVNLPFMLLAAFLLGMVPTWLYFRAQRWRLTQRLATSERIIADLRPAPMVVQPEAVTAPPANPAPPLLP